MSSSKQRASGLRVGWLVTPLSPRGGTFTHLSRWADGLAGSPISPTLFYFSPEEAAGQPFPWPSHTPRVSLDALNLRGRPSPAQLTAVLAALKSHHLDVLHTLFIGADVLGLLLRPFLSVPLVSSVEGELLVSHLSSSRRLVLEGAYRLLAGGFDALTAVSHHTAQVLSRYLKDGTETGISRRVQVLYPGIPQLSALSAGVASPPGPHLVTVGRLVPVKGLPVLVEALERLKPRVPGLRVSMVGDGPERDPLMALVRSRRLDDIVHFTGWLPPEEVQRVIASAQLLVQPSYSEGMPWTCLEAMALGVPVVASRVGGLSELIEPAEGPAQVGYLVSPGRSDRLLMALAGALEGDNALERLADMGARAQARVRAHFSAEQELAGLRRLYEGLVFGNRAHKRSGQEGGA